MSKIVGNMNLYWQSKVERLAAGETLQFRPRGNSMSGRIESGNLITVVAGEPYLPGDIVFCRCSGRYLVHLIKAVRGDQYQIGNNRGKINGWITLDSIYGRVIGVSP